MSYRTIIILPDDTGKPILDAINAAKKSLRIKMFVFSDPDLLAAVIAAKGRGVKVHVMLNPARRSGEEEKMPKPQGAGKSRNRSKGQQSRFRHITATKNRWSWMTRLLL